MYYLKKEVNDEAYFWHADKHRSFLEVDIIFGVRVCVCVCVCVCLFPSTVKASPV